MKINYYAKLNENKICIGVEKTLMNFDDVSDLIKIENDNDSLYGRKWDGEQWSNKIYETGLPSTVQDEVELLKEEKKNTDAAIEELKNEFNKTQGTDKIVLSSIFNIDARLLAIEEKLKGSEK